MAPYIMAPAHPQNRNISRMMGSMAEAATLQGDREETIQGGGREDTGGLCQSDKVVSQGLRCRRLRSKGMTG